MSSRRNDFLFVPDTLVTRLRGSIGPLVARCLTPGVRYDVQRGIAKVGDYTLRMAPNARSQFYFLYHEIFMDRVYYVEVTRPASLILDCGSNAGMSILYFKTAFPDARIIGFEAHPGILQYLRETISKNGLANVQIVHGALAAQSGTLSFYGGDTLGSLERNLPDGPGGAWATYKVPGVRLRDYLTEPVDILKMDIEGAEWEVLADSEDRLPLVEHIVIEYHSWPVPDRLHKILELLDRQGFYYFVSNSQPRPSRLSPGFRWNAMIYAQRRAESGA